MAKTTPQAAKSAANTAAINAIQTQIAAAQNAVNAGNAAQAQQIMASLPSYTTVAAGGSARTQLQNAAAAVLNNISAASTTPTQTTTPTTPAGPGKTDPNTDNTYTDFLKAQQRDTASAYLRDLLSQYGLGSLASSVDSLVAQYNYNTAMIANGLRQTDAYKTRFKGLIALQQKGVTDIANEAQYIGIESKYRQVFRDAGLQSFLGDAGSQSELDSIAKLAADYSVSVNEVQSRVADAQRVANDTAPEVKDALQRFYGVGPAQLVQYVLDPAKTTEQINRQVNAGLTSGYAARQNLNLDQSVSEQIANISGGNDLNVAGLNGQLKNAADVAMATKRLADIDQTSLTDSEIAQNEFNLSTDASQKIKKLQSSERAKFGGTSGIQTGSLSNNSGF